MPPDAKDFEELVSEHARVMASAIRRVCGPRHAELFPDVQQEVHIALRKRLGGGKGGGGEKAERPASCLYKVALTTALAVVKKHGPSTSLDEETLSDAATLRQDSDYLPVERAQLDDDAQRALRGYLAGFNRREVAELYGRTESRARHLIYRSIERLRELARNDAAEGA